jgi:hypothetical protein
MPRPKISRSTMSRSWSTPAQRYNTVRPALADALDQLRRAIARHHPDTASRLPLPQLAVPDIDDLDPTCDALYANLFEDNGSRSATWITVLNERPTQRQAATAVYELVYLWYQLVSAARHRIHATPGLTDLFDRSVENLPRRLQDHRTNP